MLVEFLLVIISIHFTVGDFNDLDPQVPPYLIPNALYPIGPVRFSPLPPSKYYSYDATEYDPETLPTPEPYPSAPYKPGTIKIPYKPADSNQVPLEATFDPSQDPYYPETTTSNDSSQVNETTSPTKAPMTKAPPNKAPESEAPPNKRATIKAPATKAPPTKAPAKKAPFKPGPSIQVDDQNLIQRIIHGISP